MIDANWCGWTSVEFLEALEKWTKRTEIKELKFPSRSIWSISCQTTRNQSRASPGARLYCCGEQHKAINYNNVQSIEERKKILAD